MWNDVEYGKIQVHILRAGAVVLYASGIQLLVSSSIGLCESKYGVLSTKSRRCSWK